MQQPVEEKRVNTAIELTAHERQEIDEKIQFDTAKIYRYMVKLGVISNGAAGLAYIFAIHNPQNSLTLMYWYTALMVVNLINLLWAIHVESSPMTPLKLQKSRKVFMALIGLICIIWGSIDIFFLNGDKEQQTTTLVFLSGALICFSITTVLDVTLGLICVMGIIGPGVIYNLYLALEKITLSTVGALNISFASAFVIVGVFILFACYVANRIFVNVVKLGYINILLGQKLENINASLEERITQRTQELETLYSLTQATLESTQEGILAVSLEGDILTYNNKFLEQWGITKTFLLTEKLDNVFKILAQQVENSKEFLKAVQQGKYSPNTIREFRLKSGVVLEYYTHSQFIHQQEVGKIHSFQDISERNRIRMQASLQDRLATTGRLVANVAHEVNNPISWILSNLHLIKQKFNELIAKNPEANVWLSRVKDLEEVVSESIEGAVRIQQIIKMFNKFGRLEKEESIPVNIHEILNTAVTMAMIQEKNNIKLKKNFTPIQPVVLGNTNNLHQVFLNLIINAVQSFPKASDDSQVITITTAREDDMFRIDITDTGSGIPEEALPHIFEPFFTTKSADEGTGLGLSICHDILAAYGGSIEVKSEVGKGTTFSVRLPIAKEES